ncbi:MAG: hypothetical protein ACRCXZ_02500 [Patescibacteria group bacterium]
MVDSILLRIGACLVLTNVCLLSAVSPAQANKVNVMRQNVCNSPRAAVYNSNFKYLGSIGKNYQVLYLRKTVVKGVTKLALIQFKGQNYYINIECLGEIPKPVWY